MTSAGRAVRDWLADQLGDLITGTHDREPPNLRQTLPLLVVTRLGGADIDVNFGTPTIAVNAFAAGHDAAVDLADRVHRLLRYRLRNYRTTDGDVVTTVRTVGLPADLPYDSRQQVFKVGGTYQVFYKTRLNV